MKVKRAKKWMNRDQLDQAVECLKAMAHPMRLQILQLLCHSRYTVGELAAACEIVGPVASQHLRLLERSGLLVGKREGKFVYYQLAEPHIATLLTLIEAHFGG